MRMYDLILRSCFQIRSKNSINVAKKWFGNMITEKTLVDNSVKRMRISK